MKAYLKVALKELGLLKYLPRLIAESHDLNLIQVRQRKIEVSKNAFNQYGKKYFSQSDEDGLTLEIVNRLNVSNGKFIEFGVGNGLENNSIILLASGWKGAWIGGEKLSFPIDPNWRNFIYLRRWVNMSNLGEICEEALNFLNGEPDLISMDFDGNDLHFVNFILNLGLKPKIFICEYNGKFPLPVEFSITYDDQHSWKHDDYFGASLQSYINLFEEKGYFLVVVNGHTGLNAFFVQNEYRSVFPDIPNVDSDKWVEPLYALDRLFLHRKSPNTVKKLIENNR